MPKVATCAVCGAEVEQRTAPRRYCDSEECRRWVRENWPSRKTAPKTTCDTCGQPSSGRRCRTCRRASWACAQCGADTGRCGRKFCSPECQQAGRPKRRQFTCAHCGQAFAPSRGRSKDKGEQRFCSIDCRYDFARAQPKKPRPAPRSRVYFRNCKMCESLFCSRVGNARYCSDVCRSRKVLDAAGARVKDLYALATKYNKLTRTYEGAEWRKALIQYLVDRDGAKCGICNRRVDITLKSGTKGSRLGPSVDHIIPRSQGGEDELANYRLTHWGCNQARGNRGGFEQLALVG